MNGQKSMWMNKIIAWAIRQSFGVFCIGLVFSVTGNTQEVSLCFENTPNPPFYNGAHTVEKNKPGITIEVLKEAAQIAGVDLVFKRMPWKRCILQLQKNQIDGAFEVSFKPAREEYAVYPSAEGALDQRRYLHSLSYFLYTLEDSPVQWDGVKVTNLKSALVGVAGYSIVNDLRSEGYPVLEGVSQKANLEMLLRGRVDGLTQIDTMTNGLIAASPKKFSSVKQHPIPLRNKLYYLVFSKGFMNKNTKLAEAMWDQLANIRESGLYENISVKYADQ